MFFSFITILSLLLPRGVLSIDVPGKDILVVSCLGQL